MSVHEKSPAAADVSKDSVNAMAPVGVSCEAECLQALVRSAPGISSSSLTSITSDPLKGLSSAPGISSASISSLQSGFANAPGISSASVSSASDAKQNISVLMQSSGESSSFDNLSSDLNRRISDENLHQLVGSSLSTSPILPPVASEPDSILGSFAVVQESSGMDGVPISKELDVHERDVRSKLGLTTPADSMIMMKKTDLSVAPKESSATNLALRMNRGMGIIAENSNEDEADFEGSLFAERVDMSLGENVVRRSSGMTDDPSSPPNVSDIVSDASDRALKFTSPSVTSDLGHHFNRAMQLSDDVVTQLGGMGTFHSYADSDVRSDPISSPSAALRRFDEEQAEDESASQERSDQAEEEPASQEESHA